MYAKTNKQKVNKNRVFENQASQNKRASDSTLQFIDNRPEAIAQRKLQEIANNHFQVKHSKILQDIDNSRLQSKQANQLQMTAISARSKKQVTQLKDYEDYLRYDRTFADTEVMSSSTDMAVVKDENGSKLHHEDEISIADIKAIFNDTSPWKDLYWYHGTNEGDARLIVENGFDPSLTNLSKAYGPGTYFAATEYAARQYDEMVMKINLGKCNLLWVTINRGTVWGKAPDKAAKQYNGANRYKEAARDAMRMGLDGCFFSGVEEWMIATVFDPSKIEIVDITHIKEKRKMTPEEAVLRGK